MMNIQKQHEDFCKAFKPEFGTIFNIDSVQFEPLEDKYYQDAQRLNWAFAGWLQAAKAQAVPEWISVKNSLPPENTLVLGMSQTPCNIFNTYNVMALDEFEETDVTHWMPLPDAPQEPK